VTNYLATTFASLGLRNYRLFFFGQAISQTGTWMQKLAQAWLVLELTDSGTWLGATVALQQLPTLLIGSWAGLLADRHPKRRILVVVAALGIVPAFLLAALTGTDRINMPTVLVIVLFTGTLDAMEKPARHAFAGEMVTPDLLPNAVTLNNVVQETGKAVGPAIGALLIAGAGLQLAFFLNALSYVGVLTGLLLMRPSELDTPERVPRGRGQLRAGLGYVRRDPRLVGPLLLLASLGLLAYNFQVLLPIFARETFDGDAGTAGALLTSLGLGSVVGGLALAGILKPNLNRILAGALGMAALLSLTAAAPTLAAASLAVFLLGVVSVVFRTLASSWLQLTAAPAMRGRVLSLLVIAVAGTTPIGAPIAGWIATEFGARTAFLGAALGSVLAAAAVHFYLGPRRSGAEPSFTRRARRAGRPVSRPGQAKPHAVSVPVDE
jgi:predicted MFS family arabinose efflux permease